MKSKNKRVAILIVAVAIIAGVLACGDGGRVGQVTPTPTKTPKPTFTATPLATDTPIPTNTPLPTDTPIPATNTPVILTATFTPPPTDTPTPIPPTATTKPTAKPTSKPKPTSTKTPVPVPTNTPRPAYELSALPCPTCPGQNNCGSTGIKGTVYSRTNAKLAGVSVAVWTGSWGAVSNPSNANGGWDLLLDVGPKPGNWNVRAVDAATCAKNADGNPTWPCTGFRSDEVSVATTATCEGAGAVNWAVVDFKQN